MRSRSAAPRRSRPSRSAARRAWWLTLATVAAASSWGGGVHAQDAARGDGEGVLSSAFTREALAMLADTAPGTGSEAGAPAAIEAAAVLLDLSAELTPEAAEMQWLRADLAERRGDRDTLREALGAYLRARPDDDAALLKAALVRVAEAQTLDGRLERMTEILDRSARGGQRTAAMRSRLAMLASEAAEELGDEGEALSFLGKAAALDPANADAAAAVYQRLAASAAPPKSLGAAAANWVFAAPIDPRPRLALARVLSAEGVHEVAAEQFARASLFLGGPGLHGVDLARWSASLAAADRRDEAASLIAERAAGGADDDEAAVQLGVVAVAVAEDGAQGRAFDDLIRRLDGRVEAGGPDERSDARLDRAWTQAALAVRPVEDADRALEQAGGRFADADPRRELAAGWILLRRGDAAEAAKAFNAASALPMARLGLARTADAADPERLRLLRQLAAGGDPLTTVLAAAELGDANRGLGPTPVGRALLDNLARRPAALWRMQVTREPLMELSVGVQPTRVLPFQPAELVLQIRNRSPLPVALGPDQSLRPVVFANVALFEGEKALGSLPTQVFNVGRRLTLAPGEVLTVPARLDHGPIGQRLAREPGRSFRFGLSVTLDPRLSPDGAVAIGPLGAVDTLRSVPAAGQAATEDAVRGWLDAMSGDSPDAEYAALIRLCMLQNGEGGEALGPRLLGDTADLLAERGPELGRVPLALCGLYLRGGNRPGPAVGRVLAVARSSRDDAVRVGTLLGQVRDPTDPSLDAAVRAGSPRLRRFAEAYTRVLAARDPMRDRGVETP